MRSLCRWRGTRTVRWRSRCCDVARLAENTVLTGPSGSSVSLLAGDEVPSWAEGMVGDHLLAVSASVSAPKVESTDLDPAPVEAPEAVVKPRATRSRKG